MFCDLARWTAVSSRPDPEDLLEVMAPPRPPSSPRFGRFTEFIPRSGGDGVLTDAERALQTGLAGAAAVIEASVRGEPLRTALALRRSWWLSGTDWLGRLIRYREPELRHIQANAVATSWRSRWPSRRLTA